MMTRGQRQLLIAVTLGSCAVFGLSTIGYVWAATSNRQEAEAEALRITGLVCLFCFVATLAVVMVDNRRRERACARVRHAMPLDWPPPPPPPPPPEAPGAARTVRPGGTSRYEHARDLTPQERLALNNLGRLRYSGCGRCGDRWNWKMEHSTQEYGNRRHGPFPLCQECWLHLATPAARWPFYEALVTQWEAELGEPEAGEPGLRLRLWQGLHAEAELPIPEALP